ncbi:hypothetical protein HN51_025952, partial [Arachis hypogaea]
MFCSRMLQHAFLGNEQLTEQLNTKSDHLYKYQYQRRNQQVRERRRGRGRRDKWKMAATDLTTRKAEDSGKRVEQQRQRKGLVCGVTAADEVGAEEIVKVRSRVKCLMSTADTGKVYVWMNNKPERFSVSSSDAAIQLDLISKVHGVSSAEEYFLSLADKLTDRRTYGALLNVYVRYRMKEKAEALFDKMRSKGYAVHSLPFNVMMTLYVNLKVYDKVDMLASEMREKNIRLDIYSYNICLSSCGSRGSIEKMEEVFDQMVKDPKIFPNWTTFSTMATMYINMNMFEKAVGCLRKVESRIKGRDRVPFHYLLSLYGSVGKKDDVYRVWSTYKSLFATIPNLGYHAIIASLVKLDDIEGAEKIYEEWLSTSSTYDPRITNLLIGCYVKKGNTDKALGFFRQITEGGGIPNSKTWEIICSGHIADERISEALSCFKEAFVADVSNKWRPRATNLSAFFKLCQDKDDTTSAEVLTGLCALIGLSESDGTINNDELSTEVDTADITDDNDDGENAVDDAQMFNQLESTL